MFAFLSTGCVSHVLTCRRERDTTSCNHTAAILKPCDGWSRAAICCTLQFSKTTSLQCQVLWVHSETGHNCQHITTLHISIFQFSVLLVTTMTTILFPVMKHWFILSAFHSLVDLPWAEHIKHIQKYLLFIWDMLALLVSIKIYRS
jgi:hypothetical protein